MEKSSGKSGGWMVFMDFDGTVTSRDTLSGALMSVAPEACADMMRNMRSRDMTLADGLKSIFRTIPTARYHELIEFAESVPVRRGLDGLLRYLDGEGVTAVLLSGGLRGMAEAKLGGLIDSFAGVHTARADLSGETIEFVSEYEGGGEMTDKPRIMDTYGYKNAICIGDGITDFRMAEKSDVVFARDQLADYMTRNGLRYHNWTDFEDVRIELERLFDANM
jgi:2-hydroxy-3-keto-5-methylthiopentenyl-1-phosphate phosphatase